MKIYSMLRCAAVVFLFGCSHSQERDTGSLRCVGACELIIDRSKTEVTTEGESREAEGMGVVE